MRGSHLDFARLEARDDLGALVWQAGEGARVHRRLRQRRGGVAGSLYEEHLWESEGLIANLALSEARRELQFFLQLVLYGSVAPQTAVKRRRWIRLCIHLEEHWRVIEQNKISDAPRPQITQPTVHGRFRNVRQRPSALA